MVGGVEHFLGQPTANDSWSDLSTGWRCR